MSRPVFGSETLCSAGKATALVPALVSCLCSKSLHPVGSGRGDRPPLPAPTSSGWGWGGRVRVRETRAQRQHLAFFLRPKKATARGHECASYLAQNTRPYAWNTWNELFLDFLARQVGRRRPLLP